MIYCTKENYYELRFGDVGMLKNKVLGLEENGLGLINKIITLFTILLLTVFPLIYHDFYFDILVVKYQFFYISILLMTSLIIISIFYLLMKTGKKHKRELLSEIFESYFYKLNITDLAMIAFVTISLVSTLFSYYKYESFWGNEGRYSGLFLIIIYGVTYFIISRGTNYSKILINLFICSSMLVCMLGILDYFRLDLLGFKKNILEEQYDMFTSTIGNINTYTAYLSLVIGITTVLFTKAKTIKSAIWYYVSMIISFFAILMGLSDNAYLALGALFAFLPLNLFKDRQGLKRYLVSLTSFFYVIYILSVINNRMLDWVIKMSGILENISSFSGFNFILIFLTLICLLIYIYDYFRKEDYGYGKKLQIIWAACLVVVSAIIVIVLLDANVVGNQSRYGALDNYLIFNDDWGTHRGYIWRIGFESYSKLPFIHKLFGHGPDTFGLMASLGRYTEMTTKYNEYFDSAHNEYLQYLFTIGPIGLLSYITFLISFCVNMIKGSKKDPYIMALLYAVICYSIQAVVNISLPISTPVFIVLIAIGMSGIRKQN